MRFLKRLIGWLCVLCLLGAPFFLFVVYSRSFAVYYIPAPDIDTMARAVGSAGLAGADMNSLLAEFAAKKAVAKRNPNGEQEVLAWPRPRTGPLGETTLVRNKVAVAVMTEDGRVIAAYPEGLVGRMFPNVPILPGAERGDRSAEGYWDWSRPLVDAVSELSGGGSGLGVGLRRFTEVHSRAGRVLAVVTPWEQVRKSAGPFTELQIIFIAEVLFVAYWLLLPIWVAMDAAWRGMRPFAWGIFVLLTNIVGLMGYLLARLAPPRPCVNCGETVLANYLRCPACGVSLLSSCPVCRRVMKPGWQYCPVCSGIPAQPGPVARTMETVPTPPATATPLPANAARAVLTVSVVDAVSGTAITNAGVSVKGPSGLQGLTSSTGTFEARKLPSGTYTIIAGKQGYEQAEVEVDVDEQSCEVARLELQPMPGRILGRVFDRTSQQPIAGAHVYIDSVRIESSALTDDSGGFALADIPAGPYTLCARADGFEPQTKLVEIGPGQQIPVDFGLEQCAEVTGAV